MNIQDITFIYASLNNGYDNNPDDPVANYHFERTVFSVNSLRERWKANILFVDWCSQSEHKFQNSLSAGIKYVYVDPSVNEKLHEGNESNQLFYEWIAKDIGATLSNTSHIIFINNDILISKLCMNSIINTVCDNKTWISATRKNIDNKIFKEPNLYNIIDEETERVNVISECTFCYGDFTALSKELYEKVEGYPYIHKHAYGDTMFQHALDFYGACHLHLHDTPVYHLNHKSCHSAHVFSEQPIDKQRIKQYILQNIEIINL